MKFSELKILTAYGLYIHEVIVSVKSRVEDQTLNGNNHEYNNRQQDELVIPSHWLEYFLQKTSKCWNKVP